jgi:GTPase SAR1 family protein
VIWSGLIPEQIAVVGDQSSGKSSLLESLTGFSFPRGAGLCTRYVTQITCCRAPETSVFISIIPRPNADETLKARLLQFQRRITQMENDDLAKIFEKVCQFSGY